MADIQKCQTNNGVRWDVRYRDDSNRQRNRSLRARSTRSISPIRLRPICCEAIGSILAARPALNKRESEKGPRLNCDPRYALSVRLRLWSVRRL